MTQRPAHLHDDRLFDHYLADRSGEALDPRAAEHLSDCESCAVRFRDMAAFLDGVRADGDADVDAVFTPERLREQQRQIARRIAQVGRPARVLAFPGRVVRRTLNAPVSRAPRWVAAAAAAGLLAGVALGAMYGGTRRVHVDRSFASRLGSTTAPRAITPANSADDAFLSDLELALDRPHPRELRALDALTPHVREVNDIPRTR